jgi:hypothetical protein
MPRRDVKSPQHAPEQADEAGEHEPTRLRGACLFSSIIPSVHSPVTNIGLATNWPNTTQPTWLGNTQNDHQLRLPARSPLQHQQWHQSPQGACAWRPLQIWLKCHRHRAPGSVRRACQPAAAAPWGRHLQWTRCEAWAPD